MKIIYIVIELLMIVDIVQLIFLLKQFLFMVIIIYNVIDDHKMYWNDFFQYIMFFSLAPSVSLFYCII